MTAYTNSVRAQSNFLTGCADCQGLAGQSQIDCSQGQTTCQNMLDGAENLIANFQATLAAFAAPDSLSAKDTRLQQDLAQADSALIAMNAAVSTGDQAAFKAAQTSLGQGLAAVSRDAPAI